MPEVMESGIEFGNRPSDVMEEVAPAVKKPDLGFLDVIGDAYKAYNPEVSLLTNTDGIKDFFDKSIDDPNYNSYEAAERLGYGQDDWDMFTYANSDADVKRIADRIDAQRASQKRLDETGGYGIAAGIVASITSLTNLIPGMAAVKVGKGGTTFYAGAKATTKAALPSALAAEAALQVSQETRTNQDAVVDIAGTVVLAGALGGAIASISRKQADKMATDIEKAFEDPKNTSVDSLEKQLNTSSPDAVGSQRVSFEDERLYTGGISGKVYEKVAKATKFLSPVARTQWNGLDSVVMMGRKIAEYGQLQKKNIVGEAAEQAAETDTKLFRKYHADSIEVRETAWKDYRKSIPSGEARMDKLSWNEAITDVLANGGKADGLNVPPRAIPFLEKSAAAARKHLDILQAEGIAAKLKGLEQEKLIQNYVHIMYNVKKIAQNPKAFLNSIMPGLEKKLDEAVEDLVKKGDKSSLDEAAKMRDPRMRQDYLDQAGNDFIAALQRTDQSTTMEKFSPVTRGPLKERTIDLPRAGIREWVVNDIDVIEAKVNRVLAGEIALQRKFGTVSFQEARKVVDNDYLNKKARLQDGSRELIELDRNYKEGLQDLEAMWDLVRGTYRASGDRDPDDMIKRALAFGRTWNYVRAMGGTVIASMTDVANVVFRHGFQRVFGTQMKTLIKSLSSPEMQALRKKIKTDLKYIAPATEKYLNSRTAANFGLGDPYAHGTGMERLMDNLGKGFSKYVGINFWNDGMKNITAMIAQSRIVENSLSGKLAKKELQYMANLGLGRSEMEAIAAQVTKHGEEVDGVWSSGIANWDNPALADTFRRAIIKDADNTIVTKGVGDVPIALNTDVGKTLTQFLSFAMASNQRILLSGLQRADSEVLQGFTAAVSMGMMIEVLRRWEKDEEIPDSAELIRAGLDRSGWLSVPFYIDNNILDPLGVSSRAAIGGQTKTRSAPDAVKQLLGPSAGLATDAFKATSGMISAVYSSGSGEAFGGMSDASIEAFRRLWMYQNMTGIKELFDLAEEGLKETIGKEN